MKRYDFKSAQVPDGFYWLNEPKKYFFEQGLNLITRENTDFWQTTHYGFKRDNGHCLLTKARGDFSIKTQTEFTPESRYDQCGLIARIDSENWIKCSVEHENSELSRLGSVVTNRGFSDWATQDISSDITSVMYQIRKRGKDFLIEYSLDDREWHQIRVARLHEFKDTLDIGVYACSPDGGDFKCKFYFIEIS